MARQLSLPGHLGREPISLCCRYASTATELLRCREMSRWANGGSASLEFTSHGVRLPASGLAISCADSMNGRRAGLGVRLLSVMIPIGHICAGISTGRTFIDSRLALKCSIDAGRKLRKRSNESNADCIKIEYTVTLARGPLSIPE